MFLLLGVYLYSIQDTLGINVPPPSETPSPVPPPSETPSSVPPPSETPSPVPPPSETPSTVPPPKGTPSPVPSAPITPLSRPIQDIGRVCATNDDCETGFCDDDRCAPIPPPSGTPSPVPSAPITPPPPQVTCGKEISYTSDIYGKITNTPFPINDQSSFNTALSVGGSVTSIFNDNGRVSEIIPPSTYNPNVVRPGCYYRMMWQRNKPASYGNKEVFVRL